MFNNIYSRFFKYLSTFNMIVLETVSYIFLGVAMMRLEPAMKIEIFISFFPLFDPRQCTYIS